MLYLRCNRLPLVRRRQFDLLPVGFEYTRNDSSYFAIIMPSVLQYIRNQKDSDSGVVRPADSGSNLTIAS